LKKIVSVLQYCVLFVMMHKDTNSLQVGRLYRALILLGLAPCLPSAFMSSGLIHIFKKILLTSFSLPFSELSLVGLGLDVVD